VSSNALAIRQRSSNNGRMQKRSSKPPRDVNQLAFNIVQAVVGEQPAPVPETTPEDGKNPAAVALGRLGGLKGGKARAAKLSERKRREIAKKAAKARWARKTS
jgi:hypothetical protein